MIYTEATKWHSAISVDLVFILSIAYYNYDMYFCCLEVPETLGF